MLNLDKPNFWSKISNNRRLSRKKAVVTNNKPGAQDFVDFYSDLFSHNDRPSSFEHIVIEEKVQNHLLSLSNLSNDSTFSMDCIVRCIKKLKYNKSPGFDDMSNEFLKSCTNTQLTSILRELFNAMLSTGFVPDGFNTSLLVPIPKKSSSTAPGDYRPISISTSLTTLFEALLFEKLSWIENLNPCQKHTLQRYILILIGLLCETTSTRSVIYVAAWPCFIIFKYGIS